MPPSERQDRLRELRTYEGEKTPDRELAEAEVVRMTAELDPPL
ncbi:hypothetical protein [Streptomyces sp. NPDC059906]